MRRQAEQLAWLSRKLSLSAESETDLAKIQDNLV
jgi:hypothetical protein